MSQRGDTAMSGAVSVGIAREARPHHGSSWRRPSARTGRPANYPRTHGIRYFHGCYSLGDDQLWVMRRRKGGDHTPDRALDDPAARPDGAPVYVILDNLATNKTPHPDLARGTGRTLPDPDQRRLGQPDRGPV